MEKEHCIDEHHSDRFLVLHGDGEWHFEAQAEEPGVASLQDDDRAAADYSWSGGYSTTRRGSEGTTTLVEYQGLAK